jgi:hypothetical protein
MGIYIYNQRVGLLPSGGTSNIGKSPWPRHGSLLQCHRRQATLHILNLREVQCHGATHHSLIHVFIWKIHLNLCVSWAHGTAVAPLLGVMGKPTADISKTYQNHTRNLRHGRLGRIKTLLISIAWTCSSPKFCLDVHPSIYIYVYIYMYIYIYLSLCVIVYT